MAVSPIPELRCEGPAGATQLKRNSSGCLYLGKYLGGHVLFVIVCKVGYYGIQWAGDRDAKPVRVHRIVLHNEELPLKMSAEQHWMKRDVFMERGWGRNCYLNWEQWFELEPGNTGEALKKSKRKGKWEGRWKQRSQRAAKSKMRNGETLVNAVAKRKMRTRWVWDSLGINLDSSSLPPATLPGGACQREPLADCWEASPGEPRGAQRSQKRCPFC